jgi:salicylate hydroxylase
LNKEGKPLRVLIVGAGLGGLTAACLSRVGCEVTVFEQAPALGEVGAGLQIGPNAVRVLRQIVVAEGLEAVGGRPASLDVHDWQTGQIINSIVLGDAYEKRYGTPYYHIHRADLHALLVEALQ